MNQESVLRPELGPRGIRNQENLETIIHNSLFMIHSYGFTLIELLIAMAVTVSVGAIAVGIITSILRGSNKTNAVNNVRQNGNFAISQMSKMIIYAKSMNSNCQVLPPPPALTPTPIHFKSIQITSFDRGMTTFSCNDSGDTPPNTIASSSASGGVVSLIDADSTTGSVALSLPIPNDCYFTCTQEGISSSPTIGIYFTLSQKGSALVEKQASIPFQTSIKVRNLAY